MNNIDILIVEDEAIVALEIKRTILKMGFGVSSVVANYDDALASIKVKRPDIVLLDIHLKNSKDGIETANAIQKISNIPIIYLTAFSDDATIERAIETNPVGYVVKPFKRADIKSTLKLAIHKINHRCVDNGLIPLGKGYLYDLNNHNLFLEKNPIRLSQKESILLEKLIEAKGEVVLFYVLEQHIWKGLTVSDNALRTLIYRLRIKLDSIPIETVPSFGFRLTFSTSEKDDEI